MFSQNPPQKEVFFSYFEQSSNWQDQTVSPSNINIFVSGFRTNAVTTDFSKILPEEVEQEVKDAAEISMGTEISDEDRINVTYLCDQVNKEYSLYFKGCETTSKALTEKTRNSGQPWIQTVWKYKQASYIQLNGVYNHWDLTTIETRNLVYTP